MGKQLIIIRHARSLYNARKTDNLDSEITEWGQRQALSVARFMKKHMSVTGFRFYTSPFLRCLQTAYPIQKTLNVTFKVLPDLREYLNHSGKPVTVEPRPKLFDENYDWQRYTEPQTFDTEFNEEFIARMRRVYDEVSQWGNAVVITHGLPALQLIHTAAHNANYVPIWDHSLDNCSITLIKDGMVLWHGRNLPHEEPDDPFEVKRAYDWADQVNN